MVSKAFFSTAALFYVVSGAQAATISYNFGTATPLATPSATTGTIDATGGSFTIGNTNGTVTTPINVTSPSSGYSGASGNENLGNAVKIGAYAPATSSYYADTLTPGTNSTLTLSGLSFGARSTSTGPVTYSLYASTDSFATSSLLGTATSLANSTYALLSPTLTSFTTTTAGQALSLRLYTYGGTGSPSASTENNRIDDVTFTATTAAGTTPTNTAPTFSGTRSNTLQSDPPLAAGAVALSGAFSDAETSATLTGPPTGVPSFLDFTTVATATGSTFQFATNRVLTYLDNGTYTIGLSVTDGTLTSTETLTLTVIPEPASLSLLGFGGLALLRRRRTR